jgi:hypothetical protein
MMCQLRCFYVILCDLWTRMGVNTDMVVHININTNLLKYTFKLNKEQGMFDMIMHNRINTKDKDKDLMKGMNILDKTKCFGQRMKIRKLY